VLWTSKKANAKHNEIRLKGEGGYILAPPSIHPNGNRYEIINGSIITIIAPSKIQINKLISAIKNRAEEYPTKYDGKVNLSEEDVYEIVSILKPHYQHGNRNDFTMYLSGLMRKEEITFESALKVIETIAAEDEEKFGRIRTLEETYKKEDLDKVCGYSRLLTILVDQTQSEDRAKQILEQVISVFPRSSDTKQLTLKFFKDYLVPLVESKKKPDEKGELKENIIGVTTKELCEYYKQQTGRSITTDAMNKTYLNELLNNGYIDEEDSVMDKRQKIYHHIVDIPASIDSDPGKVSNYTNPDRFDNFMQHSKLILPKNFTNIPENWLKLEILDFLKYRIGQRL
jgi:hypothetical protein